jgi:RNA polymerase sigma factor (sigma-70 family)
MPGSRLEKVVEHLRAATAGPAAGEATDAELLGRFVRGRDEAAFTALVRRHGPLVLGVCRRVLGNVHDAEDAFQATFLVLVRRAASLRSPEALGSWLYGVAYRAASEARRAAVRRRAKEAKAVPRAETKTDGPEELRAALDQELAGLPERYRAAVVLSDLQGKSRKEVARELGCAEGTAASRLARGRALLARRLARRGVGLAAGALAALAQDAAAAGAQAELVDSTVKAALAVAAGQAVAGAVSVPVASVLEGVLRAMLLNKVRQVAGALLLLAVLAAGTGLVLSASRADDPKAPDPGARAPERRAEAKVPETSAHDVLAGFQSNDAYADEHLTGKRLRVSGYMWHVKRFPGRTGRPDYMLELTPVPSGELALAVLAFVFPEAARKQLAPLQQTQRVVVEGRCEGLVQDEGTKGGKTIRFVDCRLIRADPLPGPGLGGGRGIGAGGPGGFPGGGGSPDRGRPGTGSPPAGVGRPGQ